MRPDAGGNELVVLDSFRIERDSGKQIKVCGEGGPCRGDSVFHDGQISRWTFAHGGY